MNSLADQLALLDVHCNGEEQADDTLRDQPISYVAAAQG